MLELLTQTKCGTLKGKRVMLTSFEKNRQILIELIYELGSFTYAKLIQDFKEKLEWKDELPPAIDGRQTIRDFLEELAQIGVLEKSHGVYSCTPRIII